MAFAEPLVCDIRGEVDLRLNFRPTLDEDLAQVEEPGQRAVRRERKKQWRCSRSACVLQTENSK